MIELNVENGLEYCIDEDLYLEVLQDYLDADKRSILDEALRNGDMRSYAVNVHALKSASKTIGADCLFDKAYALEMASKAGDVDLVKAGHDDLMDDYSKLMLIVQDYIRDNSVN